MQFRLSILAATILFFQNLANASALPKYNIAARYSDESLIERSAQQERSDANLSQPFDPHAYAQHIHLTGTYYLASNPGRQVVHWLFQEAMTGLREFVDARIAEAGSPRVRLHGSSVMLEWTRQYNIPQPLVLFFQMYLKPDGLPWRWADVLTALRLFTSAGIESLMNEFVIYTYTPEEGYLTYMRGNLMETTGPADGTDPRYASNLTLADLAQPSNDTTPVDLSLFDSVPALPDWNTELASGPISSLNRTSSFQTD